jgi:hypothetical protein
MAPPKITVTNGLHAHFKQPSGPSRPGYDWVVVIASESGEQKVMARTYDDDSPAASSQQHAQRALDDVAKLFNTGMLPPALQATTLTVPKS